MPLRALLYRRPSEPQAIEIVFDRSIYLVRLRRHRQARRYTLRIQAATREVILTIPPRGTLKEAREFAQKTLEADPSFQMNAIVADAPLVHFRRTLARMVAAEREGLKAVAA
jgi:hypothetical protein